MIGDAELMAAGRQGDAMNFDGNFEDDVGVASQVVRHQRPVSSVRGGKASNGS